MDSIQLALAIAVSKGWEVHQMDVKNAFIHGVISEKIALRIYAGLIFGLSTEEITLWP
jgi:hypothetical protein